MGAVTPFAVTPAAVGASVVAGSVAGSGGETGTVTIVMSTSVDEIDLADDLGAQFQARGTHTHYGGAVYFDSDQYLYTTVNGHGVDPGVAGTGHEVALTGTAPWTAAAWATAAETVISAAGRTVSRDSASLEVTVATPARATAAEAAQNGLTDWLGRGGGTVVGSTQQAAGSSSNSNSTGWVQVDPDDVPSGAFRVIAFGVRRGSNVTNGVRMGVGSRPSGSNGDPEGAVVDHDRNMGNSGANNWHFEALAPGEIPYYSGGEALYIPVHGDGASSSIYTGGAIEDGLYEDGDGDTLWLTDGTTGSGTAVVSPAGAVTNSYSVGVAVRLVIQEAPYQTDGNYRVVGGAVEDVHDQNTTIESDVDSIFVGWRITTPDIDDLTMYPPRVHLGAHASGDTNQIRWELWNPVGGASTMAGDTLVSHLGTTSDSQSTGWSTISGVSPFSISSNTEYRYTVKGEPATGEESDTTLTVWRGTNGAGSLTLAGYPVYGPSGVAVNTTEREVLADHDTGTDETAINFNPQVATTSPNPSNGTVDSPNNIPMFSLVIGKPAPTVTAG